MPTMMVNNFIAANIITNIIATIISDERKPMRYLITDGQIYTNATLFKKGYRPAVDSGITTLPGSYLYFNVNRLPMR